MAGLCNDTWRFCDKQYAMQRNPKISHISSLLSRVSRTKLVCSNLEYISTMLWNLPRRTGFQRGTSRTSSEPASTDSATTDYVTIDFYRYGDIHAVIALYLATKGDNNWVFAQIEALPEEWRKILIEEVKKIRINDHVPTWIRTCIKSPIRDDEEIPYLNRHAPAKEKPGARRKRQRFRKTWCYGASQSPPPPISHNSQTLPLPAASALSLLESIQSHGNAPLYQTAPHFSQTVDTPLPVRHDRDGSGFQQTNFNMSQEPASLTMPKSHSQDTRRQEILHHQSLRQWPGYNSSQINTHMQPQLPGLQQMALAAPSFNRDQTQDRGHRQDFTDRGYDGTINSEQRHPPLHYEAVHPSSLQYKQQKPTVADSLLPYKENRGEEKLCIYTRRNC